MKFSILPREKAFYELLERLADKSLDAIKLFKVMVETWSRNHPAVQGLQDLEHLRSDYVS